MVRYYYMPVGMVSCIMCTLQISINDAVCSFNIKRSTTVPYFALLSPMMRSKVYFTCSVMCNSKRICIPLYQNGTKQSQRRPIMYLPGHNHFCAWPSSAAPFSHLSIVAILHICSLYKGFYVQLGPIFNYINYVRKFKGIQLPMHTYINPLNLANASTIHPILTYVLPMD